MLAHPLENALATYGMKLHISGKRLFPHVVGRAFFHGRFICLRRCLCGFIPRRTGYLPAWRRARSRSFSTSMLWACP